VIRGRSLVAVADPGFVKGGADNGERAERETKRGSGPGGEAPSGVQEPRPPGISVLKVKNPPPRLV